MTFAKINNLTIHYQYADNQQVTTFVFVNSLGTDFRIWEKIVEILKAHGNILLYDKRGHGLSDTAEKTSGTQSYCDDLVALLKHLNIQKCVPVGLSVGGRVAMLLAQQNPELVEKLVLCDTAQKIGTEQGWNDRIGQIKAHGLAKISESVVEKWFSEKFRKNHAADFSGYKNMLERTSPAGYIQCCETLREDDLTEIVKQIQQKTLCICGSEDLSTPPILVESLSKLIPNSTFKIIEGSGHIPCVDNPEILSKNILEFVGK